MLLARNSNSLLEISFAQEIQGEVSVLEINNLTDPLTFKISDEAPVAGDECVYFDPLVAPGRFRSGFVGSFPAQPLSRRLRD